MFVFFTSLPRKGGGGKYYQNLIKKLDSVPALHQSCEEVKKKL